MTKITYLPILFILTTFFGYTQELTSETLIEDFSNGKLFVVNEFAIVKTDSLFFETLIEEEFLEYKHLKPEEGKKHYGTLGENGVHQIKVAWKQNYDQMDLDIMETYLLKYFDKEKAILYIIDDIPNQDVFRALKLLVNKPIEKVQHLSKNKAMLLWGSKGKNGAMMIQSVEGEALKIE